MEEQTKSDLHNIIREHKHNNSLLFGNAFTDPSELLFMNMIKYPELYSEADRIEISSLYKTTCEWSKFYKTLGYDIEEQLRERDALVYQIYKCDRIFRKFARNLKFNDNRVKGALFSAIDSTNNIVTKLKEIESNKDGVPEVFYLREALKDVFDNDNNTGKEESIIYVYNLVPLAEVKVKLSKKDFKERVLQNIKKNLYDHAFIIEKDKKIPQLKYKSGDALRFNKIIAWLNYILQKLYIKRQQQDSPEILSEDHIVKISFKISEEGIISVIFENNGKPFEGDADRVFEDKYSTNQGTGIGMYTIKTYVNKIGGEVFFEGTEDPIFKVKLTINLPIYEE